MTGTPDAKFGLSNAAGTDEGRTLDERINELNTALKALGAGTIPVDLLRVAHGAAARLFLKDTGAGTDLKEIQVSTDGGVTLVRAMNDDGTPGLTLLSLDQAAGSVTVGAGKLVDGVRTVRGSVRGRVNANGTLHSGTGFTPSKTGTGVYNLAFSTPFDYPPVFTVGVDNTGGRLATFSVMDEDQVIVRTWTISAGAIVAADCNFLFEAKEF